MRFANHQMTPEQIVAALRPQLDAMEARLRALKGLK
jgi:hypothetical protein